MSNKYNTKPKHPGYSSAIKYGCDFCGKSNWESKNSYYRKTKHFCDRNCYASFVREILPKEKQNAYGKGLPPHERLLRKITRSKTNHAIRDGKLTRQPCLVCGGRAEAHHKDYLKPLEIKWLCFKHHRQLHENPELLEAKP